MIGADEELVVAVDVGGTSLKAAFVDRRGGRHRTRRVPVSGRAPDELVDAILTLFADVVGDAREADGVQPVAAGLAVPGLVDASAGIARSSMILGWREVPFRDLLSRTGLPVAFGHDVLAAAYAEAVAGSAVGHQDWLFLTLGTGLGAAFVLDGRPYRGGTGRGGELAHNVLRADGPRCRCGKRGCAEMIVSAQGLVDTFRRATAEDVVADAADVVRRVRAGESTASAVWADFVAALADLVAGYIEAMDPSVVVIGGGLSEAGATLLDPLTDALRRRVAYVDPTPALRLAHFGQDAGLVGIGLVAHDLVRHPGAVGVPFEMP